MTVPQAFARQAVACAALGSPLTAHLCRTLGDVLAPDQGRVARRVLEWPGDAGPSGASVPLRLNGALHALVLTGRAPDLAAAYERGDPTADLLLQSIAEHADFIDGWLDSPPQTNEVGRSAAIIAALRFLRPALPLRVMELGASAGLNLNWHRYHLVTSADDKAPGDGVVLRPDWRGESAPAPCAMRVNTSLGVDLRPVDAVADPLRLLAYCWPDQQDRMARLRAALAVAAIHPPQVSAGDAGKWLTDQLAAPAPMGTMRVVYHTVAWQYFPPDTADACEAAMQAAGRAGPLAHIAMEADNAGDGAALTLRLWSGTGGDPLRWSLGRADFHGRWIDWHPRPLRAGVAAR